MQSMSIIILAIIKYYPLGLPAAGRGEMSIENELANRVSSGVSLDDMYTENAS